MSRYRRLRGIVFHVLPVLRGEWSLYFTGYRGRQKHARQLVALWQLHENGTLRLPRGRCWWCRLPVANRRRTYCDDDCRMQRDAVIGNAVYPSRLPDATCAVCGERYDPRSYPKNLEVDHELAIHLARKMGHKAMIAAFLLENLRWLCHSCHASKSGHDRRRVNRGQHSRVEETRQLELI